MHQTMPGRNTSTLVRTECVNAPTGLKVAATAVYARKPWRCVCVCVCGTSACNADVELAKACPPARLGEEKKCFSQVAFPGLCNTEQGRSEKYTSGLGTLSFDYPITTGIPARASATAHGGCFPLRPFFPFSTGARFLLAPPPSPRLADSPASCVSLRGIRLLLRPAPARARLDLHRRP
jgi:hypothetical protein